MASHPNAKENQLLAALPDSEFQVLLPDLESVDMSLGQVMYESGSTMAHAYFPTTSIVSLLSVMESGASAEIGVVGNEGVVGISLFMGGGSTPSRGVVQSAGRGFRLRSKIVKDQFDRSGPLMHLFLRYTQALITQMTPLSGPAALPVATAEPGSIARKQPAHDAGINSQHAGSSPGRCDRSGAEASEGRSHRVFARTHRSA